MGMIMISFIDGMFPNRNFKENGLVRKTKKHLN